MSLTKQEYQKAKTVIFRQQQTHLNCPGDILDALEKAGFELTNKRQSVGGRAMSSSLDDSKLMYCAECGNKTLEYPYQSAPDDCTECKKRLSGGNRQFPSVKCATVFKEKTNE